MQYKYIKYILNNVIGDIVNKTAAVESIISIKYNDVCCVTLFPLIVRSILTYLFKIVNKCELF